MPELAGAALALPVPPIQESETRIVAIAVNVSFLIGYSVAPKQGAKIGLLLGSFDSPADNSSALK
jgi:hypothetical protein